MRRIDNPNDFFIDDMPDEPKYIQLFAKCSFSFSLSMLVYTLISLVMPLSLPLAILIFTLIIPTSFFGINHIKKKIDKECTSDLYNFDMLSKYLSEYLSKEHIINENTACFFKEMEEYHLPLDLDSLLNVNQYIFLIVQSYYEDIKTHCKDLSRKELVHKLLDQISLYYQGTSSEKKSTFDYKDAQIITENCIFISDKEAESILHEFKEARVISHNHVNYIIKPKNFDNIKKVDEEYLNSKEFHLSTFDINDIAFYQMIMGILKTIHDNPYHDSLNLNWNLDTIQKIMSLIVRRFDIEIEKEIGEGEPYHGRMVISFLSNLNIYASLNKSSSVGIKEIINTFKGWNFFPFLLKVRILDAIFEEFELDYSLHPYHKNATSKKTSKIYRFLPLPKKDK